MPFDPFDLPLTVTQWRSVKNPSGTAADTTWGTYLKSRRFRAPDTYASKSMLLGWSPVAFQDNKRRKDLALRAYGIALDYEPAYEAIPKDPPAGHVVKILRPGANMSEAIALWKPFYGLIHTTYSHEQATKKNLSAEPGPRFRVILPTKRPLDPDEYPMVWLWAAARAAAANHPIDEGTKDISRLWYIPGRAPGGPYELFDLEGEVIDPDPICAAYREAEAREVEARKAAEAARVTTAAKVRASGGAVTGALLGPAPAGTPSRAAYVQAAFNGAVRKLRDAPFGEKNTLLYGQAFGLGGFVPTGELTEEQIGNALFEAAMAKGCKADDIWATIRRGIAKGKESPRNAPVKATRQTTASAERSPQAAPPEPAPVVETEVVYDEADELFVDIDDIAPLTPRSPMGLEELAAEEEPEPKDIRTLTRELVKDGWRENGLPADGEPLDIRQMTALIELKAELLAEGGGGDDGEPPPSGPPEEPADGEPSKPGPKSGGRPETDGVFVSDVIGAKHKGHADLVVEHPFGFDLAGITIEKQMPGQNGGTYSVVVSHHPMWPFEQISSDIDGHSINLAWQGPSGVQAFTVPRSLFHEPKKLAAAIESRGVLVKPGAANEVAKYLSTFLHDNRKRIPVRRARWTTGWDRERTSFMYGHEGMGCDGDTLYRINDDQSAIDFLDALRVEGSAEVWKATAEEMLAHTPAAGLMLAVSVASPMLEAFGWLPIGVVFGDVGGAGKSTLLRVAGSVFGSTGDPSSRQCGGIIRSGGGTSKGLVMQFRRLAGFPHLADELKPDLTDPRKRDELTTAMHQISEGREHVRATRDSRGTISGWSFLGCTALAGEVAAWDFLRKGGVIRRYLVPRSPFSSVDKPLGRYTERLANNYGHLGRALCAALVSMTPEMKEWAASCKVTALAEVAAANCRLGLDSEEEKIRSWGEQIAVALAAATVTGAICPEIAPNVPAWRSAILACWEQMTTDTAAEDQGDMIKQAWDRVRSWVVQNRHSFLPSSAKQGKIDKAVDIGEKINEADRKLINTTRSQTMGKLSEVVHEGTEEEDINVVDVVTDVLNTFLTREGYSLRTMAASFRDRGCFIVTPAQKKKNESAVQTRINGVTTPCYRLDMRASGMPVVKASEEEAGSPEVT